MILRTNQTRAVQWTIRKVFLPPKTIWTHAHEIDATPRFKIHQGSSVSSSPIAKHKSGGKDPQDEKGRASIDNVLEGIEPRREKRKRKGEKRGNTWVSAADDEDAVVSMEVEVKEGGEARVLHVPIVGGVVVPVPLVPVRDIPVGRRPIRRAWSHPALSFSVSTSLTLAAIQRSWSHPDLSFSIYISLRLSAIRRSWSHRELSFSISLTLAVAGGYFNCFCSGTRKLIAI